MRSTKTKDVNDKQDERMFVCFILYPCTRETFPTGIVRLTSELLLSSKLVVKDVKLGVIFPNSCVGKGGHLTIRDVLC